MTPLIREFVAHGSMNKVGTFDPLEAKWFDITNSINNFVKTIAKIEHLKDDRLPFPSLFIAGQARAQKVLALVLGDSFTEGGGVSIGGIILRPGQPVIGVPTLHYLRLDGKMLVTDRESIAKIIDWKKSGGPMPTLTPVVQNTDTMLCASMVAELLRTLGHSSFTGYVPVVKPGYISSKRIAKGKLPLYDWTTVVLEPTKPIKSDYQGGTHASPRHHERRGHFRRTPSGKQVWVRNCKVGNPANGTVFHDYMVKGAMQ